MARRKTDQQEKLLSRSIAIRVTQREYHRLEGMRQKSDCHSIGELIRRILSGKPITLFHQDTSLDQPMEELARIRQELRAIGVNINQITRHFHASPRESKRLLLAQQALEQFAKVEAKVNLLLSLISQLAKKW
ncbi:plasmid mobilization relaxosome protein MobC [Pontibacter sp. MBLB2868]|uniref:plasmid mobilization protein n=1 Tax=Pontibacter sp. MBLB2868 TaxID=3451555 RepID=UPI003F752710